MGGCLSGSDTDDIFIQKKELQLQIIILTVADIRSGFICLDEEQYSISRSSIGAGFVGMHNAITANLVKEENVQKLLEKFILPFKESSDNYLFNDLMIALFVNSRSTIVQKATGIAEVMFRDKDELNQDDMILLFKKLFKTVMSYSFALMDQYGDEQRNFENPKTQEEEDNIVEGEPTLLLATGLNLGQIIGESMVEKDKTLTISEFAEKCKTYIPNRFYRDIFTPKETLVRREFENMDLVDRNVDEKKNKKEREEEKDGKEEEKKENDGKQEEKKENDVKQEEKEENNGKKEEKEEKKENEVKEEKKENEVKDEEKKDEQKEKEEKVI